MFTSTARTTSHCLVTKEGHALPHVVSMNSPEYFDYKDSGYFITAEGSKKEMEDLKQEFFDLLILD